MSDTPKTDSAASAGRMRRLVVLLRAGWTPFADEVSGIMREAADAIDLHVVNPNPDGGGKIESLTPTEIEGWAPGILSRISEHNVEPIHGEKDA